jgi:hypothetical protein
MSGYGIRDKCRVNTNRDADAFVGILCENGDIRINFPLGFRISEDEKELRKEILLLIHTIGATTARRDSEILKSDRVYNQTAFPIQSYMHVISDYYARGYYKEREIKHAAAKRGKIDWNRTIKTRKPYVGYATNAGACAGSVADAAHAKCLKEEGSEMSGLERCENPTVFYLDFVTRKSMIKENELITLIHKYCVHESFEKIGWLFTGAMPAKPEIQYNGRLFKRIVRDKLQSTFNDRNKVLFRNMLAILEYEGNPDGGRDYRYGTWRFEYVWEALIDRVYGIEEKSVYFPKTRWKIQNTEYVNSHLEPDTVMICFGDVYILDAKYYKYGATGRPLDLPQSASINKQITYGEYVATLEKFKELHGERFKVYNAFLMPFAAEDETCPVVKIGEARADWKSGNHTLTDSKSPPAPQGHALKDALGYTYEAVHGILVDVKHLMKIGTREDEEEIERLAGMIRGEGIS